MLKLHRDATNTFDDRTIAVRLITMIWRINSHITGVDSRRTGQTSPLPTVVLSKGYTLKKIYTDNFCIYMYVYAVTNPLVLLFNVRPISVTCQLVICFVPFSHGETTPFTIRLVHSAYDKKTPVKYPTKSGQVANIHLLPHKKQ